MQDQRVLLLLPSGLDYISVFFGCLYARAVAVPGFPIHFGPVRRDRIWFQNVVQDAEPSLVISSEEMIERLSRRADQGSAAAGVRWVAAESITAKLPDSWNPPTITAATLAFLQYTSGSTSSPRGVMITHGNLMHNERVIQAACDLTQETTVVTWLPLHHDMGLTGTVLQPAYLGARCVLMKASRFLQDPVSWLTAISRYRADISSAPNFAYDLCTKRVTGQQKRSLDLTKWRVAINGAEPVSAETIERFSLAFAECGFRADAFYPSYGLAESTLMVSGARLRAKGTLVRASAMALEQNLIRDPIDGERVRLLVGCGSALFDQVIEIVDPQALTVCPDRTVGEIWVRGPSVGQGYWNRPTESNAIFRAVLPASGDGFLRTGDLGFLDRGELFVIGRMKELIIIRGRNFYPHDIEFTVQDCHEKLRPGCAAAFSIEVEGQEALVVVSEIERSPESSLPEVIRTIREAVMLEHGVRVWCVALVKRATIEKTTSGKTKRGLCRRTFLAGGLQALVIDTLASDALESVTPAPECRDDLLISNLLEQVASILKVPGPTIRLDRPLVALGLDSLGSLELTNYVENKYGARVKGSVISEGLSLNGLAALVLEQFRNGQGLTERRSEHPQAARYPLSPGQKGLWVLHQMSGTSTAYSLAHAARVGSRLNVGVLKQAFQDLMARHEVLRSVFRLENGEPAQFIKGAHELDTDRHFTLIDLSHSLVSLDAALAVEARRPFTLNVEPPIRLVVFRHHSDQHALLVVLHHIIADLWSMGILLRELGESYSARLRGESALFLKPRQVTSGLSSGKPRNAPGQKEQLHWTIGDSNSVEIFLYCNFLLPAPDRRSFRIVEAQNECSLRPGCATELRASRERLMSLCSWLSLQLFKS